MSTEILQNLIIYLALAAALLFVGMFLRAKIPLFRKLLLPASVIGGFVGLLLGPRVLGAHAILPFSTDCITTWSLLPGVLILPIFASVPLGNGMNEAPKLKGEFKRNLPKVLASCGCFSMTFFLQAAVGFGVAFLIVTFFPGIDLYKNFGYELAAGFSGGHGTAGALGNLLQSYGVEHWEVAQGIATTLATVGLVGGMIGGIILINIASRKGNTMVLDKPSDLPAVTLYGFTKDVSKQPNMGRETTNNSSIESISVHLGIILIDCALSYFLLGLAKTYKVPGLSSIPVWFYGLLLMYAINFLLRKLKLDWMIDQKVKDRITGAISDFAIVCAVASMKVKAVAAYIVPIIVCSILGFVVTYIACFTMHSFCFGKKDYPFERAIISWGVNTGVMINGMMLLKVCDPGYDSPTLTDFSMGFALLSIINIFTYPIAYGLIVTGTEATNFLFHFGCALAFLAMALIGRAMLRKTHPENF